MPNLSSLTKLFGEAKNLKNAAKVAGYEREFTGAVVGGLGGSLFGAVSDISEEERKEGDTRLGRIASYGMMGALGGAAIGAVSKMRAGADSGLKVSTVQANNPVVHHPTPPVTPTPPVVAPPVPKPPPVKPTGPAVNLNNGPSTVIKTPPPTPPPVVPPNTPATNVPVNPSPVTSKPVVEKPPLKPEDLLPDPDYLKNIKLDAASKSAPPQPPPVKPSPAPVVEEPVKKHALPPPGHDMTREEIDKMKKFEVPPTPPPPPPHPDVPIEDYKKSYEESLKWVGPDGTKQSYGPNDTKIPPPKVETEAEKLDRLAEEGSRKYKEEMAEYKKSLEEPLGGKEAAEPRPVAKPFVGAEEDFTNEYMNELMNRTTTMDENELKSHVSQNLINMHNSGGSHIMPPNKQKVHDAMMNSLQSKGITHQMPKIGEMVDYRNMVGRTYSSDPALNHDAVAGVVKPAWYKDGTRTSLPEVIVNRS